MSLTLNKSNAYSVEGIPSSYNTLGVMAAVGRAGLTPRNSHESVIVSMSCNTQSARSINGDLLYVYSINIW